MLFSVLSGEQENEELIAAIKYKVLYSFSSPNGDIKMETGIQVAKQRDKVMQSRFFEVINPSEDFLKS